MVVVCLIDADKSKGTKLGPSTLAMSMKYQCQQAASTTTTIDVSGTITPLEAKDMTSGRHQMEAVKEKVSRSAARRTGDKPPSTSSAPFNDEIYDENAPQSLDFSSFVSSEFIYRHEYPDAFDAAASSINRDTSQHGSAHVSVDRDTTFDDFKAQRQEDTRKVSADNSKCMCRYMYVNTDVII